MNRRMTPAAAALALACLLGGCADGPDESAARPAGTAPITTTTTSSPPGPLDTPASPAGEVEPAPVGSGPGVVVLGDSITVASWGHIHALLGGYSVRIGALRGEGLSRGAISDAVGGGSMPEVAERFARDEPEVVVLALGTNDAWSEQLTVPAAVDAMDRIVGSFPGACVVGVEITESSTASDEHKTYDRDEARAINVALRERVDVVVPWGTVSARAADELLQPDGIHTTPAGRVRFAEMVVEGVDECAFERARQTGGGS